MMWMTGTVDADGVNGGPILDNKAPAGRYAWTTYAERRRLPRRPCCPTRAAR
jgi:phospholipase C